MLWLIIIHISVLHFYVNLYTYTYCASKKNKIKEISLKMHFYCILVLYVVYVCMRDNILMEVCVREQRAECEYNEDALWSDEHKMHPDNSCPQGFNQFWEDAVADCDYALRIS